MPRPKSQKVFVGGNVYSVTQADFRKQVNINGTWRSIGPLDELAKVGGMFAVSFAGQSPTLIPAEQVRDILVLPDGKETMDYSWQSMTVDKLKQLREKMNQMMGVFPNSPLDGELGNWEAALNTARQLKGELQRFGSPNQMLMIDGLLRGLEKGIEIFHARQGLGMEWYQCYPNANPRQKREVHREPKPPKQPGRRGRPPKVVQ